MRDGKWVSGLGMAFVLAAAWTSAANADEAAPAPAEAERFFETRIRPILANRCFECHGAKKQQAELRLDSAAAVAKGNSTGPAVTPGKPDESRLIQVIRYADDDTQMPPEGKLPAEEIAALENWVKLGAPWPAGNDSPAPETKDPEAWRQHWAFQPVRKPAPPAVKNAVWPQTPVDSFVLAKLEEQGLSPSPPADRRTLIRRLSFDLVGLPPTASEVEAFVADTSADAYKNLVERLLASPQYGERWARYWLDVSRYADTKGYVFTEDRNYPEAYTYRDWVIRAFNDDMPYDRFVTYQLAADRLVTPENQHELAAMGFLTLGRRFLNNRHDIIDDRIDVVTRGLMGFTVTCARCHDHKFDPIPTADYYSLYGVFASSDEAKDGPSPLRLVDKAEPFEPYIFLRGQQGNRGDKVPRRFLMALSGPERKPFTEGSGRLELARAIASPENPLTARVLVNRVWGHHFGDHLVDTPSDFGTRSSPPAHRELLDHLTATFIEQGWSVKSLHRAIVLSATYQQQSADRPEAVAVDPENRLFWKMNRRRLDFEAQRDSLLAATGRLDLKAGGPSVDITTQPFSARRTVYAFIERQNLPGMFRTFDFASPDTHSPQRPETTVPQQALFLLNSPFVMEQATALASRPDIASAGDPADRIRRLYHTVYARQPSEQEVALALRFVQEAPRIEATAAPSPWSYGCGAFDEGTGRVRTFEPLTHWTGDTWQGGPNRPDAKLGWVLLHARGGHAGNDAEHAAVRRWTAARDGVVSVRGRLKHGSKDGDGVRARVVSSRTGPAGEWTAHDGEARTRAERIEVKAGDTLDFVADCRGDVNGDGFEWTVTLRMTSADVGETEWKSADDFAGPRPQVLDPWQRYAQVLLLANEFAFVD